MSTEEQYLSREEAAIHMINGGRCLYLHNFTTSEYFWKTGRFLKYVDAGTHVVEAARLPSGRWKIKRSPIKYSKDMWVNKRLKSENDSSNLASYLFGGGFLYSFTKTKVCNMPYKITIEEIVD